MPNTPYDFNRPYPFAVPSLPSVTMQRFLSTASLSVLTAIAIVVYSSSQSNPMPQGVAAAPVSSPLADLFDQDRGQSSQDEVTTTPMALGYGLGEELGVTGRNDLLALVPVQFSNCDVGLWLHNSLLGQ